MTTVSLVFPCYNEEAGVGHLLDVLEEVRDALGSAYTMEVIFVDDGSTDGTAERLEAELSGGRFNARVIRHERNRGLGAALRTGFAHATGALIAAMDSDCTYDPRHLVPMLQLIEQGADMVAGSAYHPRGAVHHVPLHRLVLSRNLSRLYSWVLGARIYTYTSLMRLYRAEVLRSVPFDSDDFLAVVELLVRALMQGYCVAEHPMPLTARQFGGSKAGLLRLVRDHLGFLWWLLRHRVRIPQAAILPTDGQGADGSADSRPLLTATKS